jgi:hypothetical protein
MPLLTEMDDWGTACGLLGDLDYEKQYVSIRSLLHRQKHADTELEKEIEEIDAFARRSTGSANERAIEDYGVAFYSSIFQSAAHSMAAVGMLAPFIETLFKRAYQSIRDNERLRGAIDADHPRWKMNSGQQWDARKPQVVDGIFGLAEATGLAPFMPSDLRSTLAALFLYRNKMFHQGFEWLPEERADFTERVAISGWPETWFGKAITGDQPWIFYLSDEFISHCLKMIEAVINGFGAFARARINDGVDLGIWDSGAADGWEE